MIGYRLIIDRRIFQVAAENGKVLEIDSQPERLDLNDSGILAAREYGALFCIDTDSKSVSTWETCGTGWAGPEEVADQRGGSERQILREAEGDLQETLRCKKILNRDSVARLHKMREGMMA